MGTYENIVNPDKQKLGFYEKEVFALINGGKEGGSCHMPMQILDTRAVRWFICMRDASKSHKCHLNVPLSSLVEKFQLVIKIIWKYFEILFPQDKLKFFRSVHLIGNRVSRR